MFAAYATDLLDDSLDGEYHYARKDTDTDTCSSKNGPNFPTQLDSNNHLITDTSKAYFTIERYVLEFCGYFVSSNGTVCSSDSDCVQGYQKPRASNWLGCGLNLPGP